MALKHSNPRDNKFSKFTCEIITNFKPLGLKFVWRRYRREYEPPRPMTKTDAFNELAMWYKKKENLFFRHFIGEFKAVWPPVSGGTTVEPLASDQKPTNNPMGD